MGFMSKLYYYTTLEEFEEILKEGKIKATCSSDGLYEIKLYSKEKLPSRLFEFVGKEACVCFSLEINKSDNLKSDFHKYKDKKIKLDDKLVKQHELDILFDAGTNENVELDISDWLQSKTKKTFTKNDLLLNSALDEIFVWAGTKEDQDVVITHIKNFCEAKAMNPDAVKSFSWDKRKESNDHGNITQL